MTSLDNANTLLTKLQSCVDSSNVEEGKSILSKLKICLLELPESEHTSEGYLNIATSTLELGILLSVADGDLDAFGRNVAQLKPYYNNASTKSTTKSSERKCHILGLNLMHLLVENQLSEFHAELELLSDDESKSSFVNFPINLERQLMVGSYDEVLDAGQHMPNPPTYKFFMDNLLQTVRDSIADCVEVSYQKMKINDAMVMMKFNTKDELMEYVNECRDDWIVSGEELMFQPPPSGSKASDIPSMKLISQSLTYATEMDRII